MPTPDQEDVVKPSNQMLISIRISCVFTFVSQATVNMCNASAYPLVQLHNIMSQFRALAIKNWILFKRSWFGSIVEVTVPALFIVFVLMIRNLAVITPYDETQFLGVNMTYIIPENNTVVVAALKSCYNKTVAVVSPDGTFLPELQSMMFGFGYSARVFTSDNEVNQYVRDPSYGLDTDHLRICFGITIVSGSPNYSYKLRYNISGLIGSNEGPSTEDVSTVDAFFQITTFTRPIRSGMLIINNLIHNLILRAQTSDATKTLIPVMAPMKQEAFNDDPLYVFLGNSLDMLCLLPLMIIYLRQISAMLTEKEKKIRQTMKIMGMTGWNYYTTWFLRYFVVYLIVHAIGSFVLYKTFKVVAFEVIFITFMLFDLVLVVQTFFVQVFFTRAKIGIVVGLLFFTLQFIVNFLVRNSDNPTFEQALYGSISAHSAFVSALREMLYCSSLNIPLTLNNIDKEINLYKISVSWTSCCLNFLVWILLSYYLEQVFPNEWGAKEHPCFCFKWMCRHRSKIHQAELVANSSSVSMQGSNPNIEEVDQCFREMESVNQTIRLMNVNKVFDGGKKAVEDLSMTIYNDQIFVLLGHNGAGKTTTISMLTGLLQPSSGTIEALGLDVETDMNELRQQMGVCPQHDTLYDQLTVKQHLELFGTFRGLDSEALEEQTNKLIKDVNLVEKTDYVAKDLSGGQKRRLSVAMAFSGGSKLIFLDEPTSGMDASARRYIWQMMKNYKRDRIIILTTHFMDEADFLGDRICIMNDGRLVCLGSTIFLKNKFGVGYNITIAKRDTKIPSEPIVSLIKKHVPQSKLTSDVSAQIAMQLPMDCVDRFPRLFDELDFRKKQLAVESYGVSITTLEEVFLKVAEIRSNEEQSEDHAIQHATPKQVVLEIDQAPPSEVNIAQRPEPACKFFRHTKAILVKRFRVTYRDWKTLAFEFIFPVGIILAAIFLMRVSFVKDMTEKPVDLNIFDKEGALPLRIPFSGNDSMGNYSAMANQLSNDFAPKITVTQHSASTAQQFDSDTLFPLKNGGWLKGGIYLPTSAIATRFTPIFLLNTRSPSIPLLLPTMFAQSLTRYLTGAPITITAINSPLPRTYQNLQINNAVSGFLAAFIFSMALAFKFASVISFLVKEREDRCKHQQIVSGMSIYAYWLGNFIFDMLLYMMVAAFAAGMCMAFNINSLIDGDAIYATWIIFVLYGAANLPFSYIASYLFTDYGSSQAIGYFWNFVAGGIIPTIIIVLRFLGDPTATIGRSIAWPLRLVPAFSFGESLLNCGSMSLLTLREGSGTTYKVFDMSITLSQMLFLGGGTILFWIILFTIEALQNNQTFMRMFSKESDVKATEDESAVDEDVLSETVKAQMARPEDHTILTRDLRKVYLLSASKHKVAVDKLNFTVDRGEVFGLLGVNGAGKTTTFKMLAGQLTSTSGQAYFNGMKISENLPAVRRQLGYCPQFDALLDNLTVRQQLELYYDMKSLPSELQESLIQTKIQQMNLQKYRNVLSGTLSGGNKRKLSVACAIIGDPKIVFLDEPSTGMDPHARRFMWRVISNIATIRKQSTIILTTHSMEQAQALSTRLGIMVKGNFRCLGTPQHIKSKYGQGYELEVKITVPSQQAIHTRIKQANMAAAQQINSDNLERVLQALCSDEFIRKEVTLRGAGVYLLLRLKQHGTVSLTSIMEFISMEETGRQLQRFMTDKLGGVEILEHFQTFYRFKVKTGVPIGRMFALFQENRERLAIQQYSIKQATVEQVFNRIASHFQQEDEI